MKRLFGYIKKKVFSSHGGVFCSIFNDIMRKIRNLEKNLCFRKISRNEIGGNRSAPIIFSLIPEISNADSASAIYWVSKRH